MNEEEREIVSRKFKAIVSLFDRKYIEAFAYALFMEYFPNPETAIEMLGSHLNKLKEETENDK